MELRMMYMDSKGNLWGQADESGIKALPWYKRLWAKLNKSYRNKHLKITGFNIEQNKSILNKS